MTPAVGAIGVRGDRTLVRWDGDRWARLSPGRAYQWRCARHVRVRADLAGVVVVGVWS